MKPLVHDRKILFGQLFALTLGLFSVISMVTDHSPNPRPRDHVLGIVSSHRIPLNAVSGLGWLAGYEDGEASFIAISDEAAQFATGRMTQGKIVGSHRADFGEALLERFSFCAKAQMGTCRKMNDWIKGQWEAVATDAAQRIFLLHEQAQVVVVVDTLGKNIVGHWDLDFQSMGLPQASMQESKMGEGLTLLANGHILVTKEAMPAMLIEFAPEGSTKPVGVEPLALGSAFPDAEGKKHFIPVRRWQLSHEYAACDLSELAQDHGGQIFILSRSCGLIARVNIGAKDTLKLDQVVQIPMELKAPVGLIVLKDGSFGVADDSHGKGRSNFFVLADSKRPYLAAKQY